MVQTIAELLKVFLEKHFIPTIISIAVAIVALLLTPLDSWIIVKIGKALYLILVFCVSMLIVELVFFSIERIRKTQDRHKKELDRMERANQERERQLKKLWEKVDELEPSEKSLIDILLETNNKPFNFGANTFFSYGSIFRSDWFVSTTVHKYFDPNTNEEITDEITIKEKKLVPHTITMYKLRQEIYDLLKYSEEKYGRISNF